jgi:hypothetical protein
MQYQVAIQTSQKASGRFARRCHRQTMSSPGPVDHTLVCLECGTLGTAAAERGWRGLRCGDFSILTVTSKGR